MSKPKLSTINKMSDVDLYLVNDLLVLCANLYDRISSPPKEGPHSDNRELDRIRNEILLKSLKVGERVWYPRKGISRK